MNAKSTTVGPDEQALKLLGAARNIKRLITVNPAKYDTQLHRVTMADMVHIARLHNHKAIKVRRSRQESSS